MDRFSLILEMPTTSLVEMNACKMLKLCFLAFFFCLTGSRSFGRKSLHHIGNGQNPYELAISIIGKTLSAFDEDNLIPCYGFGDGN